MPDNEDPTILNIVVKDTGHDGVVINYSCSLAYFKNDQQLALDIIKCIDETFKNEMEKRGLFIHSKTIIQ